MSDDEIKALREHLPARMLYGDGQRAVALADEALARGAQRDAALMELDALHVPIPEATVQALLDDAAGHLDTRVRELRERVAQLETALRDQANWIKSDGSGCWCANTSVCKNDPWCREARAALAAGKP